MFVEPYFEEAYDHATMEYLENADLTPQIMILDSGNVLPDLQTIYYTVYDDGAGANVSGLEMVANHNCILGMNSLAVITGGLPAGNVRPHRGQSALYRRTAAQL